MLTGDKGLTAKMIGIQCGLVAANGDASDSVLAQITPAHNNDEILASINKVKD